MKRLLDVAYLYRRQMRLPRVREVVCWFIDSWQTRTTCRQAVVLRMMTSHRSLAVIELNICTADEYRSNIVWRHRKIQWLTLVFLYFVHLMSAGETVQYFTPNKAISTLPLIRPLSAREQDSLLYPEGWNQTHKRGNRGSRGCSTNKIIGGATRTSCSPIFSVTYR